MSELDDRQNIIVKLRHQLKAAGDYYEESLLRVADAPPGLLESALKELSQHAWVCNQLSQLVHCQELSLRNTLEEAAERAKSQASAS
jgi:hypothetical protein